MRGALLLLALLLSACGAPEPPLVVNDLEITRPMPGMQMSAGFLVITNNTGETARITKVTSPQFEAVEVHETTIVDGVSRMRELDALEIPARSSVVLERGGKHLMLMRPRDLQDSITLQFFNEDLPVLTIEYSFLKDERK
ncbi:MAG: copper chaperone PCu(A)C [Woeseiaceae bacterium]|jgi:copper(I)-binding protein